MAEFHTHYKPKVYTASKIHHAAMWRTLRGEWADYVEFTARWPDHEGKLSESARYARVFWMQDIQDVVRADCVLVYGQPGEKLRGALVEAGAGIATGKHVVVVGNNPDFGSWQYHPLVTRVPSLDEALLQLIGEWRGTAAEAQPELEAHITQLLHLPGDTVLAKWSDGYENSLNLRNYPSEDETMIRGRLQQLRVRGQPSS